MLGGGILGHQGNMSRKGAMGSAAGKMMAAYQDMLDSQQERFGQIETQYNEVYSGAIEDYGGNYADAVSRLDERYANLVSQYTAGMDESIAAMDVGIEDSRAAIRQATQSGVRRQQAANAITGLGNTTYGSAAVAGLERQGALQEGVLNEQYASARAGLLAGKTQGLSGILGNQITQGTALAGQHMQGLASLQTGYAQGGAGLGMQGLNQFLSIAEAPIQLRYQNAMQRASMPTGMDAAAGVMGGIGSGLLGGLMG
jgi:hypothetical protein